MSELGMINLTDFSLSNYRKGIEHEDVVILKKALDKEGLLKFNDNFPKVTVFFNKNKDIISADKTTLLLYKYENLVNENDQFIIPKSDYNYDDDGNLVLLKNRRLYFYPHYQDDKLANIQVVIKNSYKYDTDSELTTRNSDGSYNIVGLNMHQGKDILIPTEFKSFDDKKNLVIDKNLLSKTPGFLEIDSEGNLLINKANYVISEQGIIQPQSAMVIIDYHTGELKAIVGGRNITGQKIFNRAINPRQPGSSIKPLGVYLPAIDSKKLTAASVFDDVPSYLSGDPNVRWPKNWYDNSSIYRKYWGLQTLRRALEYSINVIAVKVADELGVEYCYDYLKKFNFTTLVDSGKYNDVTLSSVSLGGMTKGVTPLELTTAYGALANGGVMTDTITYTKVIDNKGNVILYNEPQKHKICDEKSAFIVQDMMRTAVTTGIAKTAAIYPGNQKITVAGKTGTTSDKLDAWFVGYTPYYVAGVWFGNDVNMPLDQGSTVSAKFWRTVMAEVHSDLEDKTFEVPDGLIKRNIDRMSGKLPSELSYEDDRGTIVSEYFIPGTEPTEQDDVHVKAVICTESGKLAGPDCPVLLTEEKVFIQRKEPYNPEDHLDSRGNPILLEDSEYQLPEEYCDIHVNEFNIESDYIRYGLTPVQLLPDGTRIAKRPFYIELTDGSSILAPIESNILLDGSVILPDGSIIKPFSIYKMPEFQTISDETQSNSENNENVDNNQNNDITTETNEDNNTNSNSILFQD
jgi:penicillin-binding protein 1A